MKGVEHGFKRRGAEFGFAFDWSELAVVECISHGVSLFGSLGEGEELEDVRQARRVERDGIGFLSGEEMGRGGRVFFGEVDWHFVAGFEVVVMEEHVEFRFYVGRW